MSISADAITDVGVRSIAKYLLFSFAFSYFVFLMQLYFYIVNLVYFFVITLNNIFNTNACIIMHMLLHMLKCMYIFRLIVMYVTTTTKNTNNLYDAKKYEIVRY